jgi:hypothetical protein
MLEFLYLLPTVLSESYSLIVVSVNNLLDRQ